MPVRCNGRKNYQIFNLYHTVAVQQLFFCIGATFDVVSGCYSNHKRMSGSNRNNDGNVTRLVIFLLFYKI
jgi:hypothetical protein